MHQGLTSWQALSWHARPQLALPCPLQILPAVYNFVGASLNATPTQLGNITLGRAMVQALSSPVGGFAGGRLQAFVSNFVREKHVSHGGPIRRVET